MSQIGDAEVTKFRSEWKNRNLSARKKFEHLRSFFRFCQIKKWLPENPMNGMKPPIVDDPPVLPFTEAEMTKILGACAAILNHPEPSNCVRSFY